MCYNESLVLYNESGEKQAFHVLGTVRTQCTLVHYILHLMHFICCTVLYQRGLQQQTHRHANIDAVHSGASILSVVADYHDNNSRHADMLLIKYSVYSTALTRRMF